MRNCGPLRSQLQAEEERALASHDPSQVWSRGRHRTVELCGVDNRGVGDELLCRQVVRVHAEEVEVRAEVLAEDADVDRSHLLVLGKERRKRWRDRGECWSVEVLESRVQAACREGGASGRHHLDLYRLRRRSERTAAVDLPVCDWWQDCLDVRGQPVLTVVVQGEHGRRLYGSLPELAIVAAHLLRASRAVVVGLDVHDVYLDQLGDAAGQRDWRLDEVDVRLRHVRDGQAWAATDVEASLQELENGCLSSTMYGGDMALQYVRGEPASHREDAIDNALGVVGEVLTCHRDQMCIPVDGLACWKGLWDQAMRLRQLHVLKREVGLPEETLIEESSTTTCPFLWKVNAQRFKPCFFLWGLEVQPAVTGGEDRPQFA